MHSCNSSSAVGRVSNTDASGSFQSGRTDFGKLPSGRRAFEQRYERAPPKGRKRLTVLLAAQQICLFAKQSATYKGRPLLGAPRADPYMQLSRIRLLPRVQTANACRMRSSACDTLTRLCVRHALCWFAFPWSPPFAPPAPQRIAPLCSPASQLLWWSPTSHARASSATAPRLPDADQNIFVTGQTRDIPGSDAILLRVMWSSTPAGRQCLA